MLEDPHKYNWEEIESFCEVGLRVNITNCDEIVEDPAEYFIGSEENGVTGLKHLERDEELDKIRLVYKIKKLGGNAFSINKRDRLLRK